MHMSRSRNPFYYSAALLAAACALGFAAPQGHAADAAKAPACGADDSGLTSAWPVPVADEVSARSDAVAPGEPTVGHARTADDTVALAGADCAPAAVTAAGRLTLARP